MTSLMEVFSSEAAHRLGWTLLHSLWQLAAVGAIAAWLLAMLRGRSAGLRYVASCAGLVAMLTVPIVTYCLVRGAETGPKTVWTMPQLERDSSSEAGKAALEGPPIPAISAPTRVDAVGRLQPLPEPPGATARPMSLPANASGVSSAMSALMPWLAAGWLLGVVLFSIWNVGGWIAACRLKRLGTLPSPLRWTDRLASLASRMGISRSVRLVVSPLVGVPMVIGWIRPVILVPLTCVSGMSAEQIDAILAHELAHVRRFDGLANLVQTAAETLLFYHPAVWWISRRIRIEREYGCDDVAVGVLGSRVRYADALAAVERSRGIPKLALAAAGQRYVNTLGRVRRVLGVVKDDGANGSHALGGGLVVLALIAAFAGCMALAGPPSSDNDREGAEESAAAEGPLETVPGSGESDAAVSADGRIIQGKVTDASGQPIPGATVEWGFFRDPPEKRQRTTTDRQGSYRLAIRSYGVSYRVGVWARGMAPAWRDTLPDLIHDRLSDEEALPPERVDFELEPAHLVSGVVVDSQGRPVAGATIEAETAVVGVHSSFSMPTPPSPIPGEGPHETTTDSEGRFRLEGMPPKHVRLTVKAPYRHVNARNYPV
ncbi:MAG: M56 family metallopeptidase, partial [Planctomycetota bacterium]